MPHLIYTENAQADLIRLFRFLAVKNRNAARRAIKSIRDTLDTLTTMPEIGRRVEGGFRECMTDFGKRGYLALYEFDAVEDKIIVYALRHQKENAYKAY